MGGLLVRALLHNSHHHLLFVTHFDFRFHALAVKRNIIITDLKSELKFE